MTLKEKLNRASSQDPAIVCDKANMDKTLGSNPDYLKDIFGITKNDLIRLERKGYAMKTRYETPNKSGKWFPYLNRTTGEIEKVLITGPHRVRWIIFKEALQ